MNSVPNTLAGFKGGFASCSTRPPSEQEIFDAGVRSGLQRAQPTTPLYGFFYNSCVHESAAALVSLHTTKRGAWQAMRKHLFDAAVEDRDFGIQFAGRSWMRRKPREYTWHGIQAVELQS